MLGPGLISLLRLSFSDRCQNLTPFSSLPSVPEDTGAPTTTSFYLQGALPTPLAELLWGLAVGLMGPLCPVSLPHTAGAFLNTAC